MVRVVLSHSPHRNLMCRVKTATDHDSEVRKGHSKQTFLIVHILSYLGTWRGFHFLSVNN